MGDFEDVVNVNLNGVARSASVAIDDMKANNGGTIIVISSYAGWRFVDVAGPAYSSTKLALGALVESMNSELGLRGIRATNLCPGEVFTPIFLSRPNPPSPERIAAMLTPDDVAAMVNLIVSLPPHVCVNEVVMTPLSNHFYDRSVFPQ
jgi:NADP-dependent 3-hydroxy acid dehydrogenase YdfG